MLPVGIAKFVEMSLRHNFIIIFVGGSLPLTRGFFYILGYHFFTIPKGVLTLMQGNKILVWG